MNVSWKRDYLSRLETLLVFLIFNCKAKMKLVILAFFDCGESVKISIFNSFQSFHNFKRFNMTSSPVAWKTGFVKIQKLNDLSAIVR